jgi:hypothetical protein
MSNKVSKTKTAEFMTNLEQEKTMKEKVNQMFIESDLTDKVEILIDIEPQLKVNEYEYAIRKATIENYDVFYRKSDELKALLNRRKPQIDKIMDKEELAVFNNLPNEVKIYRSMTKTEFNSQKFGVSWTTEKEIAENYAYKNQEMNPSEMEMTVHCMIVKKENLIAYSDKFHDSEIIYVQSDDDEVLRGTNSLKAVIFASIGYNIKQNGLFSNSIFRIILKNLLSGDETTIKYNSFNKMKVDFMIFEDMLKEDVMIITEHADVSDTENWMYVDLKEAVEMGMKEAEEQDIEDEDYI